MDRAGHLQGKWVGTFGLGMHNKAQHTHACGPNGVCVGGGGCEAGVRVLVELQCPQDVRATAGVAYVAKCGTFPKI